MTCPFLKETHVKYCERAQYRKLIREEDAVGQDVCSSPTYADCLVYQREMSQAAGQRQCPYFRRSLVQYCSAGTASTLVPFSEAVLNRCGDGGYRHCDAYADYAAASNGAEEGWVGGVRVPKWLSYSPNHMWLELHDNGSCHIGIDALLADALGQVDSVLFVNTAGVCRPSVVLGVGGIDFQLVFPNPVLVSGVNVYLRSKPSKVTEHPYSSGWLFQAASFATDAGARLIRGAEACAWMEQELQHISRTLHGNAVMRDPSLGALACDGGGIGRGCLRRLGRGRALALFNEFCSPFRTRSHS